jgi:DNA-binding LacI/PurR family transcriptional regulator
VTGQNENSRATILDVAARAGVSIATVSRVLNKTGPVAEATTTRVFDAIRELNYTPHAAARVLASRRTNTLGLILREISGPFFQPMLRGIEAAASEHGFDLLIHCTQRLNRQPHYPLSERNSDGLLVFTDSLAEAELERLGRTGFPIVLLHRSPPPGLNIPVVTFENKSGARRLVDYLIETCGYRRIAFLAGPPNAEDSKWREMGYRESLEAHGIPFDPALIRLGGFSEEVACQTVQDWLRDGLDVDAIFSADDESAVGAMRALKEAGLRIPEDIAVVGFDDIQLSRYVTPTLTTVHAPIEMAGYEAIRQLVSLIRTGEAAPLTMLPTELVIRESCGGAQHKV